MFKYVIKVFDKETGNKISQVIVPPEYMLDTVVTLRELGIVKGYLVDFDENKEMEI